MIFVVLKERMKKEESGLATPNGRLKKIEKVK